MKTHLTSIGTNHAASPQLESNRRYAVVLGGGGARGLAHLGAMKAIGERRIGVSKLIGVSMGAMMAGLCAVERSVDQATDRVLEFLVSSSYRQLQSKVRRAGRGTSAGGGKKRWALRLLHDMLTHQFLGRMVRSASLLPGSYLDEFVDPLLPDVDIEDLSVPLHIVTVDLVSGRHVVLSSGSLRTAVRASMSIPGIFPPVPVENYLLCDVGVYDAVPCDAVDACRSPSQDKDGLIAVDVGKRLEPSMQCTSAMDNILRFQDLAEQHIRRRSLQLADLVIRPHVQHIPWFDFTSPQPLIQAGYDAGIEAMALCEWK